jgi:RNA polymerase sigma-70 factor (ECF subfamily)
MAIAGQHEEAELVMLACSGDHPAFALLVERYQQRISSYLTRQVADPEEALDLTQETFVRAYRAIGQTEPGLLVRPWLYRIATNLARDHLRRQRRFAWLPLRVVEDRSGSSKIQAIEEGDLIRRVLMYLSPAERTVLLLRGLEALSYAEASAILGVSSEAVRKRFRRAKERFQDIYEEMERDESCGR